MPSSRSRWFGVHPWAQPIARRGRWPRLPSTPWPPPSPSAPAPGCRTGRARPRRCCARSAAARATRRSATTTRAGSGAPCVRRPGRRRCAIQARPSTGDVLGRAWGPGADWALEPLPRLLGADDDPTGFEAHHHPEVAEGWRRHPHWRIGAHRAGDGVAGAVDPRAEGDRQAGLRRPSASWSVATASPRPARSRPLRLMVQPTPATIAADPVVGVAAARRPARPVPHRRHRLPARLVAGADHRGVGRGGRPAAAHGARDRRVDQRRGAPARARRPRRGQLRRLPPRQLESAGRSSGHDVTDDEMAELLEP